MVDDRTEAERALTALAAKYPQYVREPPQGPVIAIEPDTWAGWAPGWAAYSNSE